MGAQPIAASDWLSFGGDGTGPWAQGAYDNPPELINTLDPSYEKIAELDPDLILDVKSSGDQERYDKLSAIAPTVGVPDGVDAFTVDYDDHVKMIAEALGKPELADEITKKHQDKLAEVRDKHPEWKGRTVSVLGAATEGWGAYLGAYGLTDYGFTENPKIADRKPGPDGFTTPLTEETLADADSDLVVAMGVGRTPEDVQNDPAWKRLPATRAGHSVVVPEALATAFSMGTPQSEDYVIDKIVPLLEQHTASDGSTSEAS
jgi:iron complex transport system substrate-binding protein